MTQQIGQYRILGELGAGGMGVVYRAFDTGLQREVALKRLRSEFAASSAVLDRFRNEAKLQGRLNHPNIAQLYSLAQTHDAFCIVMEFVDGMMVKDLLPLNWEQAASILLQALDALGYAHSLGVLHRDIKPENILIDRRGMVKIMDFGIAYAVGSQRMTREKSIIGTLEYMSPERILGKPMDGRSDIYALGILFFEMLSGRLPFDIPNEYDLLRWQLEASAPSVTSAANVPAFLDEIIQRAMMKEPEERYSTCSEMAAHLRSLAPHLTGSSDALRTLVAAYARPPKAAVFDGPRCYGNAARFIAAGDLKSAEKTLRDALNNHPREESLRHYHTVVAWTYSQIDRSGSATDEQLEAERMLSWLRLIAADRIADRGTYARELEFMRGRLPDLAVAQLLRGLAQVA
jgi:serine/threonine-protein kinase